MTYTINGKKWTKIDINQRCDELIYGGLRYGTIPNFCNNPSDTDAIIDKCWDELNESILRNGGRRKSHWQDTMQQHNCTKLIAACICYIELNE
ncbi:MAG: hypothetical protein ACJASL_003869 [Paraglaciecola sp.]|jgi:hypothetical protein